MQLDGRVRFSLFSPLCHSPWSLISPQSNKNDFQLTEWQNRWVSTEFLCGEGSGCELFKRATTVGTDDDLEHLAGPGCSCVGGYSGHQISVQEMKGCRAIQCLLSKHMVSHWKPEPDDQDFENETGYFLTGVGDGSATDGEFNQAYPVRHGVTEFWAINSASEVRRCFFVIHLLSSAHSITFSN